MENPQSMFEEQDYPLWEDEDSSHNFASASLPSYTARNVSRAHAALLDNVVVSLQANVEIFRLVRTHIAFLEQWHEQHTGWRIQRGATFFRLERHLHTVTPVFLDDKLKKARDFVCLTWLLWFAEKRYLAGGGRNQQFLLSQLADELQKQSETVEGTALDFRNQQDRYSMWRALDYLTNLGGLRILEGEVKKWLEDSEQAENEALYEFTPITHSLVEALHEERVAAITELLRENRQLTTAGRVPALAQAIPPLFRAWRTLLLGPALFRYDDPDAFHALKTNSEQVSNELADALGWLLELNSDYACIVRGGSLSIGAGPGLTVNGAYDQMILLLCSLFRNQVEQHNWTPDAYGCLHVTHWDINPLFSDLRQRFGNYWGATIQNIEAKELLTEMYQRMRQLGLLRGPDEEGNMLIMPTAARYNVSYTQEPPEVRKSTRTRSRKTTPAPQLSLESIDQYETGNGQHAQKEQQ
ncbi:hypothetical protein KDA_56890 [Dictyobacter alpinus]|uniref:TIGR02678 family protein n=1 Tax=Dictyobacter alpinus TaxID=2014873 RepID=A0A402BFN8_9CHLR|nr:DUF2398 family protein [Dictyobacter alpinus]GCE30205.1 hypothetical protein KDA_56890 [Dictyobacter alpinus]